MTKLPEQFVEKMCALLGDEADAFFQSYEEPRRFGLRVNTAKISVEDFCRLAPFHLTPVPWVKNGFYYEEEDHPTQHPFYYAGLYYMQEPSAMTPASVLPVEPGERVLDLCAAPGGKATELGARLGGRGLLAANDISASRAKGLLKNIEVFGIPNAFVLNEVPAKIADRFEGFFDKILVDAPCSGEGMFRKDPDVARAWTPDKPTACAAQQKEIILQAARMLRPGGQLLYSTCTFAPEEDEQVISFLLEQCPDMELLPVAAAGALAPGRPEWAPGPDGRVRPELARCARIWPHLAPGEGHFLALLRREGEPAAPAGAGGARGRAPRPDKVTAEILSSFLKDITADFDPACLEVRKNQAYYVPADTSGVTGLTFLRNGLYLGEIKKDRFEPSQSLAMALRRSQYASSVNLSWADERVYRYLRGETITVDDIQTARPRGWQLVCVNGYPLGWGKLGNGLLKNKYLAGWRMKS